MGKQNLDWIEDGEKFAMIGLNIPADPDVGRLDLPDGFAALTSTAFELPDHWREWLGTTRAEDVQSCNLFLLAKMRAKAPTVLDAESQLLQERVGHWFMGLTLVSKSVVFNEPFVVVGGRVGGEIDVRSFGVLDQPFGAIVADDSPLSADRLREATQLAKNLETFNAGAWVDKHWRLLRCLAIYQDARCDRDICNRIHQFTRCIEGLISPKQGETTRQFKSRTELFVGPHHHDLIGDLYVARSDFEHLHEDRYLSQFDRETRIRLAKLEAESEWIARSCLVRILLDPDLIAHFGSEEALNRFWSQSPGERVAIWGGPIDPLAALKGFNFDHVRNEELGARG